MTFTPAPETVLTREVLSSLVLMGRPLEADMRAGDVFEAIKAHPHEFFGVVRGTEYVGLISRSRIAMLLSGHFGFAVFARQPIVSHLLPDALVVNPGESLLSVLDRALSRTGQAFHHDLAVVEHDGTFLGILPMPTLVRLQSELVAEQTRRATEQRLQLRQSESRFETLFENGPLGFALLTRDGLISSCNLRLCELLLIDSDNKRPTFTDCVAPRSRVAVRDAIARLARAAIGGATESIEVRVEPRGGEARLAQCDFYWVAETEQVGVCAQDVTIQRRMEQRLQQKEKSALLDSLAGGIAHELNNKLTPTLGFAEVVARQAEQLPGLAEPCLIIRQSVEEAADLVQQLLNLSRPPALRPRTCDLVELTRAAIGMLRFRLRELGCEPVLDLPTTPVWIEADPPQIKQVIMNLGLNAIDAMIGQPRRELHARLGYDSEGICLRLIDTGTGIAPEFLQRIFDPFFTTKGVNQGTGLGLSVCLSIVQQHDGTIEVESTGREGTVFALRLPAANIDEAFTGLSNVSVAAASLAARPEPRTVLVIDDEDLIASFVECVLAQDLGCRVLCAGSVEEAMSIVERGGIEAIVSDVRLPGMNGLEFYTRLAASNPALARHFVFMTGDAGSVELQQRLAETGCGVLRKPFSVAQLTDEVRPLLAPAGASVATIAVA